MVGLILLSWHRPARVHYGADKSCQGHWVICLRDLDLISVSLDTLCMIQTQFCVGCKVTSGSHFTKNLWDHNPNFIKICNQKFILLICEKMMIWSQNLCMSQHVQNVWPDWLILSWWKQKDILFLIFSLWSHKPFVKWIPMGMFHKQFRCPFFRLNHWHITIILIYIMTPNKPCWCQDSISAVVNSANVCFVEFIPLEGAKLDSIR